MPDEVEEVEEGQSAGKGKKFLLRILLLVGGILLGIFLMIVISNLVYNMKSAEGDVNSISWTPEGVVKQMPLETFVLDSLELNLSDPTGTNPAFIKINLALAFKDDRAGSLNQELLKRKFEIRDRIIHLISTQTYEDMNSSAKIDDFKQEVVGQVNMILMNGMILDVYIGDLNWL